MEKGFVASLSNSAVASEGAEVPVVVLPHFSQHVLILSPFLPKDLSFSIILNVDLLHCSDSILKIFPKGLRY